MDEKETVPGRAPPPGGATRVKDRINTSANASPIERLCVDRGLRITKQRRIVASVLSTSFDHPDVEELHRRVRKIDSRISLSTVYRTVATKSIVGLKPSAWQQTPLDIARSYAGGNQFRSPIEKEAQAPQLGPPPHHG
jgi:hypothetical protein